MWEMHFEHKTRREGRAPCVPAACQAGCVSFPHSPCRHWGPGSAPAPLTSPHSECDWSSDCLWGAAVWGLMKAPEKQQNSSSPRGERPQTLPTSTAQMHRLWSPAGKAPWRGSSHGGTNLRLAGECLGAQGKRASAARPGTVESITNEGRGGNPGRLPGGGLIVWALKGGGFGPAELGED